MIPGSGLFGLPWAPGRPASPGPGGPPRTLRSVTLTIPTLRIAEARGPRLEPEKGPGAPGGRGGRRGGRQARGRGRARRRGARRGPRGPGGGAVGAVGARGGGRGGRGGTGPSGSPGSGRGRALGPLQLPGDPQEPGPLGAQGGGLRQRSQAPGADGRDPAAGRGAHLAPPGDLVGRAGRLGAPPPLRRGGPARPFARAPRRTPSVGAFARLRGAWKGAGAPGGGAT